MNKKAYQYQLAVKPVEWQTEQEEKQVIITYLILNTVFYIE